MTSIKLYLILIAGFLILLSTPSFLSAVNALTIFGVSVSVKEHSLTTASDKNSYSHKIPASLLPTNSFSHIMLNPERIPQSICNTAWQYNCNEPRYWIEHLRRGQKVVLSGGSCTLQRVCWYLFSDDQSAYGYPDSISVYADVSGIPSSLPMASLPVSQADTIYWPNSVCVDFTPMNLTLSDVFWIALINVDLPGPPLIDSGTTAGTGVVSGMASNVGGVWTLDAQWYNNPDASHIIDIELCCESTENDGDVYACEACCGFWTSGQTGNTDCDSEGKRNLADITRLIDNVYISKDVLCCTENGNVDGDLDAKINLADITRLIDHVYISKAETAVCL